MTKTMPTASPAASPRAQNYILRDIPPDLWRQAKHVAVDRGVSLRDLLLDGLRKEIAK